MGEGIIWPEEEVVLTALRRRRKRRRPNTNRNEMFFDDTPGSVCDSMVICINIKICSTCRSD